MAIHVSLSRSLTEAAIARTRCCGKNFAPAGPCFHGLHVVLQGVDLINVLLRLQRGCPGELMGCDSEVVSYVFPYPVGASATRRPAEL